MSANTNQSKNTNPEDRYIACLFVLTRSRALRWTLKEACRQKPCVDIGARFVFCACHKLRQLTIYEDKHGVRWLLISHLEQMIEQECRGGAVDRLYEAVQQSMLAIDVETEYGADDIFDIFKCQCGSPRSSSMCSELLFLIIGIILGAALFFVCR